METKWVMIAIAVAATGMFSAMAVDEYSQNIKEIEFARAGLQECVKGEHIVWKRECK